MKFVIPIIILLVLTSFVVAEGFGYSDDDGPILLPATNITNIINYINSTNSSNYWITNIGSLDDVNATQFNNVGGTLNIDESWFSGLFDSLFDAKDTDDLSEGSTNLYDNSSWNETLADTLYAAAGAGNASWNQTLADTLYAPVNYGDDWNKTYADTLYSNDTNTNDGNASSICSGGTTYLDGEGNCDDISGVYAAIANANNDSFNQSLTDSLYLKQLADTNLNMTDSYNITIGGCLQYWNGTCFFTECSTTTSI